jgi:hypothetical protein
MKFSEVFEAFSSGLPITTSSGEVIKLNPGKSDAEIEYPDGDSGTVDNLLISELLEDWEIVDQENPD